MQYLFFLLLCIGIQGTVEESSSSSAFTSTAATNPSADFLSSVQFAQEFTFFTKDQSSTQCLIRAYEKYAPQGCGYLAEIDKAVFTVALLSCKMEVLHGEPIQCDLTAWLTDRLSLTVNTTSTPPDTASSSSSTSIPRSLYKYCNKEGTTSPSFTTESWLTMNNHIDNLCYFAESRLWRQQAQQTSFLLLRSANSSAVTLQLIANESEQLRENTVKALDEANTMRQQVIATQAELYSLSESTKGTYRSVGGVLERIMQYTEASLWIQSTMMTNYYFLECIGFYGLLSYLLWIITAQPQARRARFSLIIGILICAVIEYFMISDRIRARTTPSVDTVSATNTGIRIEINDTGTVNSTTDSNDSRVPDSPPFLLSFLYNLTAILSLTMDWIILPFLTLCNWVLWLIYTPLLFIFRWLIGKIIAAFFSGSFAEEMEYVLSSAEFHVWSIQQRIWLVRSIYVIYSGIVILYYVLSYVDYGQLNFNMLTELREETRTILTAVKDEVTKMAAIKASVGSPPSYATERNSNAEYLELTDDTMGANPWIPTWIVPWVNRIVPSSFRRRRSRTTTTTTTTNATPSTFTRHRRASSASGYPTPSTGNAVGLLTLPTELVDTTYENHGADDEDEDNTVLDPDYDPSRPDDFLPPLTGYTNPEAVESLHDVNDTNNDSNNSNSSTNNSSHHPPVHPAAGVGLFANNVHNVGEVSMNEPFVPLRSRNDYLLRPRDTPSGLAISGMLNRALFGEGTNVYNASSFSSSVYKNPVVDYESPEAFSLLVGLSQRASALARSIWSRVNPVHFYDPAYSHTLPSEGIDSIDTDGWSDSDSDDDDDDDDEEDREDENDDSGNAVRPPSTITRGTRIFAAETLDNEDDERVSMIHRPLPSATRTPNRTILPHPAEELDEEIIPSGTELPTTTQRGRTKSRSSTAKKGIRNTATDGNPTAATPLVPSTGTGTKRPRAQSTIRK